MAQRSIVYPDADPELADLIVGDRLDRLQQLGSFTLHLGRPATTENYIARIKNANAMILGWSLPTKVMRHAGSLKIISFTGTGVQNMLDLAVASELGITITNTPGYANDSVAEHALALLLSVAHKLHSADQNIRNGAWGENAQGITLRGKTLGLIGLGGVGYRMAELASAIGMKILVWTRHPEHHTQNRLGLQFAPLDQVLSQGDAISLHMAFSPQTEQFIGERELSLMKNGVLFINTARGELVDEAALTRHLYSRKIAMAGLDVFSEEPLSHNHPLCQLDNVVLTPHSAYQTPDARIKLVDMAIANLEAFFKKKPINVFSLDAMPPIINI